MERLFPDEQMATNLVSKHDLAIENSVTPGRISQLIAKGMPVEPNGLIDRDKARAWIDNNISEKRRKIGGGPRGQKISAQAALQVEQLELMRLRRRQLEGEVIDRGQAQLAIQARAKAERDAHLAWLQRVTPVLAAELDVDPARLFSRLDHHLREHLNDLSRISLDVLVDA